MSSSFINKLNRRERYVVGLGLCFVILYGVMQFGVFPMIDKEAKLKKQYEKKQGDLADIRLLKGDYEKIQRESGQWEKKIKQRKSGFTLYSLMNELAKEIEADVAYMKPSESKPKDESFPYKVTKVETKLRGISLKQLTDYLYKLEDPKNMVSVQRLSITKKEKTGKIDVILQAETFES